MVKLGLVGLFNDGLLGIVRVGRVGMMGVVWLLSDGLFGTGVEDVAGVESVGRLLILLGVVRFFESIVGDLGMNDVPLG